MESLIMIGQFSEITATSKRMLRHYDKMEILKPVEINQDNGYRYYSHEQVSLLYSIKILQGFGFSLTEISSLIEHPTKQRDFVDLLKDKEASFRNQIDADVSTLLRIRKSIEVLNTSDSKDHLIELQTLNLERSSTTMEKKITTQAEVTNPSLSDNLLTMKKNLYALPGLSMFTEYMEEFITVHPNVPVAFLTFDVDKFAPINDQYGFDVGDNVLFKYFDLISQTFQQLVNDGHGIMARLGGDEIAIFLHDITHAASLDYANTALSSIRSCSFAPLGYDKQLTSTCGIYYTHKVDNVAQLRHNSTKAMMEGKRLGGGQTAIISN